MTKDEKKYLSRIADLGCIICYRLGYMGTPCEIHHVRGIGLGIGVRSSHYQTIGLCPPHHRGDIGYHGLGRKAFERLYNVTERELLKQTQELLNEENESREEDFQGYD